MTLFLLFFQLENVSTKLLEYGVLGVVLIGVAYVAFKMMQKINADQEIWREEAIESRKAFIELSQQQNENSKSLINIRERDIDQNKDFHRLIEGKLDRFPKEVREELRVELLEQKINKTSSGT